MSEVFDSIMIRDEALGEMKTHDAIFDIHEYTKAVLAVLERHGFLDIVEKREDGDE